MEKELKNPGAETPATATATTSANRLVVLDSFVLFAGRKDVRIRHDGQNYHLSITRQNKLILTK